MEKQGPFFDAVLQEEQETDPALMDSASSIDRTSNPTEPRTETTTKTTTETITTQQVNMMSVTQLKAELDKRGLQKQGNKPVLKERLLQAIATGVGVQHASNTRVYPNPADGFAPSAHWVQLQPSSIPVRNPVPEGYHGPTNRDGLCEKDLFKFDKTFKRDKYVETSEEYKV